MQVLNILYNQNIILEIPELIHYELGKLKKVSIRKLHNQKLNIIRARLECSDNTYIYYIKRNKKDQFSKEDIQATRVFLCYLKINNFNIQEFINTKKNEYFVENEHTIFEVIKWLEGDQFSNSTEEIFSAGKLLASIHRSMGPEKLLPDWPEGIFTIHNAYQHQVKQRLNNLPFRYYLADTLTGLKKIFKNAQLPMTTIHGDFSPWNILFKHNIAHYILDPLPRYEMRLYDIAYAITQFCYWNWNNHLSMYEDNQAQSLNYQKLDHFLSGYLSLNSLAQDEVNLLYDMIICLLLEPLHLVKKDCIESVYKAIQKLNKEHILKIINTYNKAD